MTEREKCLQIPIVNSLSVEMTESFFVTLESLDNRIQINATAKEGEIEIWDDDSTWHISTACICIVGTCDFHIILLTHLYIPPVAVVGFSSTVYMVRENEGVVQVCINVKPNIDCPITFPFDIHFYTSDYSACT